MTMRARLRARRRRTPARLRMRIDGRSTRRSKLTSLAPATFRQSAQTHTDWVNAMLLCNLNQTVITASSDRTIRAWNPHSAANSPALVGRHRDYVKSLAWAKHPSVLFSGALDRMLSIWDIGSSSGARRQVDPKRRWSVSI